MNEASESSRLQYARPAWLKTSTLCGRDAPITTNWQAIGWWESRRVPYNLIVGSAGILSALFVGLFGIASHFFLRGDWPVPTGFAFIGIVAYAAVANVLFTGGWLSELVVRQLWPQEADRFATLSFTLGLQFSVLLTITPAILIAGAIVFGLLARLFGVVHKPPAPPFQ